MSPDSPIIKGHYYMTYYERYYKIINNRIKHPLPKNEYGEKHHILPKSLYPDLVNDKKNIVRLSAFEHFKAHYYLWKYYQLELKNKRYASSMCYAIIKMHKHIIDILKTNVSEKQLNVIANEFDESRKEFSKYTSYLNKTRYKDPEYKQRVSKSIKDTFSDPKFRSKMSEIRNKYKQKILQYSLDGIFIKEWFGLKKTAKILGYNYQCIGGCLRGEHSYAYGYIWRYKKGNKIPKKINVKLPESGLEKPILQYNLNGEFIKEWRSVAEAKRWFFEKYNKKLHFDLKRRSSGGYMWREKTSENFPKKISEYYVETGKCTKIIQYDKDMNIIAEWSMVKIAAEKLGFNRKGIESCIQGRRKTYKGFIWKRKCDLSK